MKRINKCQSWDEHYGCAISPMKRCDGCPDADWQQVQNDIGDITSITFEVESNEETVAFFLRKMKGLKSVEDAINERVRQLFDEYIGVEGEKADEAYDQVLKVFMIGYRCGWSDHYNLFNEKSDEDAGHREA